MKINLTRTIKLLSVSFLVFSFLALPFTSLNKVAATFQECSENTFCFFTDIWNGSQWNANSAVNVAGGEAIFRIGLDNRTLSNSGVNKIKVNVDPNLNYKDGTMKIHDVDGPHTADYFGVTETDILTTGINLPSLSHSQNPSDSYQVIIRFEINPNLAEGNYSFDVEAIGTNSLGNFSNSATVKVNVVMPEDSGLNAKYYSNKYLYGTPVLQRIDPLIDSENPAMGWNLLGSPGTGVPVDSYSVQWTGQINTEFNETYTFYTKSDDGIRVWIDDVLRVDKWIDRGNPGLYDDSFTIPMTAGWHNIRIEYYEHLGGATARLFWNSPSQTGGAIEIVPQQNLRQTYTGSLVQTGLKGEYFDNDEMQGSPVLTKTDSAIYFIWGAGEPAPGVPADHFSVKWTGRIYADYAETYTFCFRTDDGSRMWINGQTVFDDWQVAGFLHETCGTAQMNAGWNLVRLDMFEFTDHNAAMLFWSSPSQTGGVLDNIATTRLSAVGGPDINAGLQGEYFNNTEILGAPDMTRIDNNINFDWYMGSPDPAIDADDFSARWTGFLNITQSGNYKFVTYSDNGVRIWIDDVLVLDNWAWTPGSRRSESGLVNLTPGNHTIRVEYFDGGDAAGIQVLWTTPSDASEKLMPSARLSH